MRESTMSGKMYRKVRKEDLGMSQRELAEALGVTERAISMRETGGTISNEARLALRYVVLENLYDMTGVFEGW